MTLITFLLWLVLGVGPFGSASYRAGGSHGGFLTDPAPAPEPEAKFGTSSYRASCRPSECGGLGIVGPEEGQ